MLRLILVLAISISRALASGQAAIIEYGYTVVASHPHSSTVFTQGLEYRDGRLYESGGQYGQSKLLIRTLADASPIRQRAIPKQFFAEGLTVFRQRLFLLTWREGQVFSFDADTLEPLQQFTTRREAWGLTNDGEQLIMSDGSDRLYYLDPATLDITGDLKVTENGLPLTALNELEWVNGLIYANVWQTDRVVMIDPASGAVVGIVNLGDLLPRSLRSWRTDVLNGIAYDPEGDRLWVTGKNWPRLYQIKLITPATAAR